MALKHFIIIEPPISFKKYRYSGRLIALADVYDALISRRVYKKPFTHSKSVEIISEGRGEHFDPEITDVFLDIQEDFREIAIEYADHEDELEALRL